MITIKKIFDYRTPKGNGEIPLRLRVTHNRKTSHISLNLSFSKEQISKIERGTVLDPELSEIISEVDTITNNARKIALSINPFSIDELKRRLAAGYQLEKEKVDLLSDVIDLKIDLLARGNQLKSKSIYNTTKNMVNEFKPNTRIHAVDEKYLRDLEDWYINKRVLSGDDYNVESCYNTLSVYLRSLKAVINLALDKKILDHTYVFPFGKNKYEIKTYDIDQNILTTDEVDRLMSFSDFDSRLKSYQINALNHWKICFLCNGANMKDVVQFKWTDISDGVLTFVRQKTENKTKTIRRLSIPIIEPLRELIEKVGNKDCEYIFGGFITPPKESTIQNKVSKMCKGYNTHLKEIGKKMNLRFSPTISTSRHAYGNYLAKNDIPIDRIAEMMGHKDKYRITTYHYIGSLDKKTLFETNDCLRKFS